MDAYVSLSKKENYNYVPANIYIYVYVYMRGKRNKQKPMEEKKERHHRGRKTVPQIMVKSLAALGSKCQSYA
ncbi:hypothetical protein GCM10027077_20890 [Arenimonas maotaiensis]